MSVQEAPPPAPAPDDPAELCRQMWARGIALYPDLRAGGGINLYNPGGADYGDIRPLLVAQRAALYRHLCDSLTPQDACELAAFCGFGEAAIVSMLRRLVQRREPSSAGWDDERIARMAAHAIDQADRYPEEWIRLGMRRDTGAPIIPFDEEIAAGIFQAGGGWADALAVLTKRRDAYGLPVSDEELQEHAQGGYWLLYGDMGALTFAQHRLRILRRGGDGYFA